MDRVSVSEPMASAQVVSGYCKQYRYTDLVYRGSVYEYNHRGVWLYKGLFGA